MAHSQGKSYFRCLSRVPAKRRLLPLAAVISAFGPIPLVTREGSTEVSRGPLSESSIVPPPRTPSIKSSSGSAYDARDGYTINHLKVELASTVQELASTKATLDGERRDWTNRSYLYESEILGLRSELDSCREFIARKGYVADDDDGGASEDNA